MQGLPKEIADKSHPLSLHHGVNYLLSLYALGDPALGGFSEQDEALLSNPDVLLAHCRMSFSGLAPIAYNFKQNTLFSLSSPRKDGYQFPLEAAKRHPSDQRRSFQAWCASSSMRDTTSENNKEYHTLKLDEWLPGTRDIAERVNDDSTWLQYWRLLSGVEGSRMPYTSGETVVEMKLSSLFLLFMLCNRAGVKQSPNLGEDGIWRLPAACGNGGEYEHLFGNFSQDVVVRVA